MPLAFILMSVADVTVGSSLRKETVRWDTPRSRQEARSSSIASRRRCYRFGALSRQSGPFMGCTRVARAHSISVRQSG